MSRLSLLVCIVLLFHVSACGDDDGNNLCAVGDVQSCECTGLPEGIAICDLGLKAWQECECPPAPSNSAPVTVGNLMWQTTLGPSLEPSAATSYCAEYSEAGHSDWRLPSRAEFETFFSDCEDISNGFIRCTGQCEPASFCSVAASTWYRTSSDAGAGSSYVVHTGNGFIMPIDDSYSVSTICVRDAH